MSGFSWLEETIYTGAMSAAGDPTFLGLLILGFFIGFVYLQGTRMDVKLLIIVPALFLALCFVPILKFIMIVGLGIILMIGLSRIMRL